MRADRVGRGGRPEGDLGDRQPTRDEGRRHRPARRRRSLEHDDRDDAPAQNRPPDVVLSHLLPRDGLDQRRRALVGPSVVSPRDIRRPPRPLRSDRECGREQPPLSLSAVRRHPDGAHALGDRRAHRPARLEGGRSGSGCVRCRLVLRGRLHRRCRGGGIGGLGSHRSRASRTRSTSSRSSSASRSRRSRRGSTRGTGSPPRRRPSPAG